MKRSLTLLTLVFVVATTPRVFAKEKGRKTHAPLPQQILTAKTVAFVDKTGQPQYADIEYQALVKWGRFKVVDKSEKPDLIFLFSASDDSREFLTVPTSDSHVRSRTVAQPIPVLSVVDPSTGEVIWSMTGTDRPDGWGKKPPIVRRVDWSRGPLQELKLRIEVQENH